MPKALPADTGGYYHVIIRTEDADRLSSANAAVTIRPEPESEAHTLGRRFNEIGRNQPRKYKKCRIRPTN